MDVIRLIPGILLKLGRGAANVHVLSMQSQRSYPAVYDYAAGNTKRIDLDVMTSILSSGLGMSQDEILNLKLGDLFEFRPEIAEGDPGE